MLARCVEACASRAAPSSWSPRTQGSLAVAALDVARVLADRDGITFRAQGTCMYPTLRPGDVLRIRSCSAAAVDVGDIAVCRTPDYLFSHRVIATGERDGDAYVVTRPDRAADGADSPSFDDDLLGVVVAIERNGRSVPLQPAAYRWPRRAYHRARLTWMESEPRVRLCADALAAVLQRRAAYEWAARRWYAHRRPSLRFTVRAPVIATLGDAVSREVEPSAFDPDVEWRGRRLDSWTLIAQVGGERRPAASLTFARDADGAWRPQASTVRVRYRGSGLDAALLRQAEEIIGRSRGA